MANLPQRPADRAAVAWLPAGPSASGMSVAEEFLRFTSVAAVGMTLHFSVLVALVELIELEPLAASAAGFMLGACCNYFLNYHVTFRSCKRHRKAMPKFLLVAASGLALNTAVMAAAIEAAGSPYPIAQGVAIACVLVSNFALNRVWTFRHAR